MNFLYQVASGHSGTTSVAMVLMGSRDQAATIALIVFSAAEKGTFAHRTLPTRAGMLFSTGLVTEKKDVQPG